MAALGERRRQRHVARCRNRWTRKLCDLASPAWHIYACLLGGLFSYDGAHPLSRGQALVANEWIKVINTKFNAQIPPVGIGSVAGLPIGKVAASQPALDYSRVE